MNKKLNKLLIEEQKRLIKINEILFDSLGKASDMLKIANRKIEILEKLIKVKESEKK